MNHLHFHVCDRSSSTIGDEERIMIEGERESQVVKENELYTLSTSIYLDCHIVSMKLSQPLSELRNIPDNLNEFNTYI